MPTVAPVNGGASAADTADQRDAAKGAGMPEFAGVASATALSTTPARRYPVWMQAVALILAVALSLMSWNETTIAEARSLIVGDAVPMASAPAGDEGDGASGEDADGADGEEGAAADEKDGSSRAITEVYDEDLAPFLPTGLVAADGVIPVLSDGALQKKADTLDNAASKSDDELTQAFAERFSYSLEASGALQDSDGNYQVNGAELALTSSFGDLDRQLDGGHLGGWEDADGVALVFNAPFVYRTEAEGQSDADGKQVYDYATTLSEEEWKFRKADGDGMRVVLHADELPQGWSVYTQHGDQFLKRTAKELADGLSGVVVFRYDGVQDENGITEKSTRNQLTADAALPSVKAYVLGDVPAKVGLPLSAGYVVNSYTAGRDDDNKRKANDILLPQNQQEAVALTLVNAEPAVALNAAASLVNDPTFTPDADGNGEGTAAFLLTLDAAKGELAEKGYQIDLADAPDAAGKGGMNADTVRAFDITAIAEEDREGLDLADAGALEAAGAKEAETSSDEARPGHATVNVAVEDEPALTALPADADEEDIENHLKREIVVLVPYSAPSLKAAEVEAEPTNPDLAQATQELLANGLPSEDEAADPVYDPTALKMTLTASLSAELVQEELVEEGGNALKEEDGTIRMALPEQTVAFAYKAPEPEQPQQPAESDEPAENPTEGEEPQEGEESGEPGSTEEVEKDLTPEELMENTTPVMLSMLRAGAPLYTASPRAVGTNYKTLDPTKHFDLWLNVQGANKRISEGVYLVSNQETPIIQTNVKTEGDSGYYGGIDFDHLTAFTVEGLEKYATQLELWVPYLYFNEKGGLTSTYYYNVWTDPNKTEADPSYPNSYYSYLNEDATYMSIKLDTDLNTDWWVYLKYNEAGDMVPLDDYFISQGGPEGMALADCKWGLNRVWVPDGKLLPSDAGVTAYTDGTEVVPGQLYSYKGKVYRIADLQTNGFTGCLVLKYKGRQAEIGGEVGYNYQMPVGCAVPSFVMNMNGAIPENAGGSIIYGGQTYNYSKGKDVYLPGGKLKNAYTIPMTGDPGTFGLRKITFLKTNLEFETTYTKMSDNVLYDRYNYMVYKVTTKNTSPLGSTASIDFVDYALRAMNTESNNMEGMLKEDHAAWLYNKTTGEITKVDNPSEAISSANSAFVGVPNQGGVLIYNVTGWTDDQWDSLDMAKFSNIDEVLKGFLDPKSTEDLSTKEGRTAYLKRVGAPISQKSGESDADFASRQNNLITGIRADGMRPIPYATRGQSGTIAFIQREDRVDYRNARYGYLVPAVGLDADGNPVSGTGGGSGSGEGDEGETKPTWVTKDESASEVSFLVAIPYTTNISLTAGKDGRAYYVTLQSNMTARFGGLGDNDYSWGANQAPFPESFKEPTVGMDFSKYAIEKKPGQTTETLRTTTTESYVGYPSTFLTNGIATTGNVPLYGEEAAWFRYKDAQLGADNQPLRDGDGHILYKTDGNGDPIYVTVRDSGDVPSWATAEIVNPTAGPVLEESLPDYFKLMNLEILIDPNNVEEDLGEGYVDPATVNLSSYYDTHPEDFPKIIANEPDTKLPEGVVVQFEVEEPLGADQYKNLLGDCRQAGIGVHRRHDR